MPGNGANARSCRRKSGQNLGDKHWFVTIQFSLRTRQGDIFMRHLGRLGVVLLLLLFLAVLEVDAENPSLPLVMAMTTVHLRGYSRTAS